MHQKNRKFSDTNWFFFFFFFHISAQNIDCGYSLEPPRWCGSNEYPQSMFEQKYENNVYPVKPQFYYIKMGFKGVKILYKMWAHMSEGMFSTLRLNSLLIDK